MVLILMSLMVLAKMLAKVVLMVLFDGARYSSLLLKELLMKLLMAPLMEVFCLVMSWDALVALMKVHCLVLSWAAMMACYLVKN